MYKLVYYLFLPPRLSPSTSLRNLRNVRKQNRNLRETCAKHRMASNQQSKRTKAKLQG